MGITRRIRQGNEGDALRKGADIEGHIHCPKGTSIKEGDIVTMKFNDEKWRVKIEFASSEQVEQNNPKVTGYRVLGECTKRVYDDIVYLGNSPVDESGIKHNGVLVTTKYINEHPELREDLLMAIGHTGAPVSLVPKASEAKSFSGNEEILVFFDQIRDPKKRQEFEEEYNRLAVRCGENAMISTLPLYLLEQEIQDNKGEKTLPEVKILVNKNTSEIIARLAEKGYANCYLSSKDVQPTLLILNQENKPTFIGQFLSKYIRLLTKKNGLPILLRPGFKKIKSSIKDATYISPSNIRSVFAKIDSQY
jgi:hypothetical protein